MQGRELIEILEDNPVIIAVKNDEDLQAALKESPPVVFVLYGNLNNIGRITRDIKSAGKQAIVHIDLIEGLFPTAVSVDYLCDNTDASGIITTKSQLIKKAKERDLVAIQRFFVLDSLGLQNTLRQLEASGADLVEILPGVMPKILKKIASHTH
ncbi:MAG: glycerol-3-phosphate responsive antiterminator, partial [Oscillospiraceae bacterium]